MEAGTECEEKTWLLASDNILKSFYLGAQPYISYLPYWKLQLEEEAVRSICSLAEQSMCGNLASAVQRQCGMESYILFEDQVRTWKPLSFCAQKSMIRVYKYHYMSEVAVVPYVILNHIDEEGLKDYCEKLVEKQVFHKQAMNLITGHLSKEVMHFLYSALTYVLSYAVGAGFLSQYNIGDSCLNRQIESYNFGGMVRVDQSKIDDIIHIFDFKNTYFIDPRQADVCVANQEAGELLKQARSRNEDVRMKNLVSFYLKMSGQKDEELAAKNAGRMQGIEFSQFQKNAKGSVPDEIWPSVILTADTGGGTIACSTVTLNGKVYACSHLHAGEMNSAGNEDDLVYYIYPLMRMEQFGEEKHLVSVMPQKERLAKKISQSGGSLTYSSSDFEVKQLIDHPICSKREEYYLQRFPAYENDELLRNCMQMQIEMEMEFEKERVTQ